MSFSINLFFGDKLKVKVMFSTKENSNDFENGPRSSEIIFVFQPSLEKLNLSTLNYKKTYFIII